MKRAGTFLVKCVYMLEYQLHSPDEPTQIPDTQFT